MAIRGVRRPSIKKKKKMELEDAAEGMDISGKIIFDCETCATGKMTQCRNRETDKKAAEKLGLIHCDLAGPINPLARQGSRYAKCFVDDYSGAMMVYFLKQKSDAAATTERVLADCAPFGCVKWIRTDNGTEFTSAEFRFLLVKNQIKQEFSVPYSPH